MAYLTVEIDHLRTPLIQGASPKYDVTTNYTYYVLTRSWPALLVMILLLSTYCLAIQSLKIDHYPPPIPVFHSHLIHHSYCPLLNTIRVCTQMTIKMQ